MRFCVEGRSKQRPDHLQGLGTFFPMGLQGVQFVPSSDKSISLNFKKIQGNGMSVDGGEEVTVVDLFFEFSFKGDGVG
jgi:hypothetical protein